MGNNTKEINQHISGVVESLLFVNEKPVTLDQIKKVIKTVNATEIKKAIRYLQDEYEAREGGVNIIEIAGGYQMLSNPAYASYIRDFYKTKHKEKLSKPALETMAIIAYKQPVTRGDVESIRSVNSDGVVNHLLNKELIKIVGRKDIAGRPYLYGTTKLFLEYFGLKSLEDLPKLEEFPKLEQMPDKEESSGESQSGDESQGNNQSADVESNVSTQEQETKIVSQEEGKDDEHTTAAVAVEESPEQAADGETTSASKVTEKAEEFIKESEKSAEDESTKTT